MWQMNLSGIILKRSPVTGNTLGISLRKFKENTSLADVPFSRCLSTSQDVRENVMAKISVIVLQSHCCILSLKLEYTEVPRLPN
jgi:Ran GTPase-activating protein (RanGAP) involved in mRNA processing and transport